MPAKVKLRFDRSRLVSRRRSAYRWLALDDHPRRDENDLGVDVVKRYTPNAAFKNARIRWHGSRQALADAANLHLSKAYQLAASDIGLIERGVVTYPRPPRRAALRMELHADTDAEIGLYDSRTQEPIAETEHSLRGMGASADLEPSRLPPPPTAFVSATVPDPEFDWLARVDSFVARAGASLSREADYHSLVSQLIDWARKMNRRDVLYWLSSAAAAAAAAPVLEGLDLDAADRVTQAIANPHRVDDDTIAHIEAVLWRCMRQDDTLGPQAALDTTLAQIRLVLTLMPGAEGRAKDRLLSLYANLSRFAGWLSFDLGNYEAAADHYETARTAAHRAHDTELGAFVLCNLSHLATWRGQPRTGIDHALAAIGWATQTDDDGLKAYAWDVAARAYALDQQEKSALNAIEQASNSLTHPQAGMPPDQSHVYFYSRGQLASTKAACHLYLGQDDRGVSEAEKALTAIDSSFVRNLALTSLYLGTCLTRSPRPDVDRAAKTIGDAARLAAHNRSPRLTQRLRQGWTELAPWRQHSAVAHLGEKLVDYGIM
ncbi:hypothetical protein [Paractinoplanes globisporus]|uniref:Uncharacterized protein n=1 Tax=Paractinoplanes globisporus TaxID=113565 RepID=A0ABW6WI77_9ACTN|nr:hypothetical protein [Actinoplanes globisporus]